MTVHLQTFEQSLQDFSRKHENASNRVAMGLWTDSALKQLATPLPVKPQNLSEEFDPGSE
jgi:hypothetical protein